MPEFLEAAEIMCGPVIKTYQWNCIKHTQEWKLYSVIYLLSETAVTTVMHKAL